MKRLRCVCVAGLGVVLLLLVSPLAVPQDALGPVAAGEFGLARAAADGLAGAQRDGRLSGLALQQSLSGDPLAASRSIASIGDPGQQAAAIQGVRGGGSLADFTQLMSLIETTVAPDTWEALGGPSTMAPYPGGIFVDAEGLVRDSDLQAAGASLDDIAALLGTAASNADANDWRQPSPLRVVSLRRLAQEWIRLQTLGQPPSESLYNVGGLSRIEYVMIDEAKPDILLAGAVGGIETSNGWPRDRKTGAATLQLPVVMAVVRSVFDRQSFGCTIDPTNEGIARSMAVAAQIQQDKIPIGNAADALQTALGRQTVSVFGTTGDGPLGWMLVEADRHMKQLALGQQPMPRGVPNYLDVVTKMIAQGPPDGQLLRLWFTANPISIRADADRNTFQLVGRPIKLASEDQRPDQLGNRHVAAVDPRSRAFTAAFNQHFDAIAMKYPIYSSLEGMYAIACVSELVRQHMDAQAMQQVLGPLAHDSASTIATLPTPRVVDSIAVMHTVKHRGKRHHIIVASGGVLVDSSQTLTGKLETYDSLASSRPSDTFRPASLDRWWWNAGK
ncbi:DUF1598 domain-containing protein [Roseimaritima ulvae]|uniref:DUF1598 domain-containing protein n=1 Tax=Roseimaritima ulvae TaxID=980254 RepID=A0A5B9QSR5_9BACT|nr:DUF1598 domain-containing protein [Roseimaritima ulvae]QEG40770.1 hypothetical protein UC8_27870 [Roseimaritima ulvae]